ncbi:hypothetical protein OBBRIDRAFT_738852 [Obba rivulosa]|uniref:Methyltransferase domain-containing protein n=1 Tax=Obba rivulosa TaxID=1052685 RepID=A0A8E2AKR4_9APHY|nr:hypothetical protein OBBRIDRAFT_738852 [Obba rivulosa]
MYSIAPEVESDPNLRQILPLNPALLDLSDKAIVFLRDTVSEDSEELKRRIFHVQKNEKHPYLCIYAFQFVNVSMSEHDIYPSVLEAGQSGDTIFLDLGCCMGTDARKLVYDGYPATNILACDIRPEFIDLGFHLFGDGDACPIHFFTSDIFGVPVDFDQMPPGVLTTEVTDLEEVTGSVNHIFTGALFHLFDESTQCALALRLLTLLRRKRGDIIFGIQQGLQEARYVSDQFGLGRFVHSAESWVRMWRKVFAEAEGEEFKEARVKLQTTLGDWCNYRKVETSSQSEVLYWSIEIV